MRVHLQKADKASLADICASFQQAAIDVLVRKTMRAARSCGVNIVTMSGGVSCNKTLRAAFEQAAANDGLQALVAEPVFSTDNAAMIAVVAACRLEQGEKSPWELDVNPNLRLAMAGGNL